MHDELKLEADIRAEAEFLCARLRELEGVLVDDDTANEFYGHVVHPLARLENLLARTLPPANADVERVAREILERHVHPKVFSDGWPLHLDDVLRAIKDALTKPPALPRIKTCATDKSDPWPFDPPALPKEGEEAVLTGRESASTPEGERP